eukprot:TRINITY_DN1395_c0_g1_i2.p1 TRINITY_DN1395_c0_g1~~TRINITY_DN1395_c0_g1_i2.p1  ORF type:complete len:124 (+),score=19.84 TRINITY_DN1395_c0_g1_i2:220-591(+)
MLSDNVWVEASLCNGAQGYVVGAIFNQDQPPPALPVAVIVQFDGYTGPSIHPHLPRCAPILPLEAVWGSGKSRLQIPLRPSYAMTIHKSQGQTWTAVSFNSANMRQAQVLPLWRCRVCESYLT